MIPFQREADTRWLKADKMQIENELKKKIISSRYLWIKYVVNYYMWIIKSL